MRHCFACIRGKRPAPKSKMSSERASRLTIIAPVALAFLLFGLLPTLAMADPSTHEHIETTSKSVWAGARVRFFLQIGPTSTCITRLGRSERTLRNASRFDWIEITVDTSPSAAPGGHAISLTCGTSRPVRLRLTILQKPNLAHYAPLNPRLHIFGTHRRPLTAEEATSEARARWLREGSQILSRYRSGQCTDWAAQKRPDIIQRVNEALFISELLHRPAPPELGPAKNWPTAAAAVGFIVSDQPTVGSLVVWDGGIENADPTNGHIGYVESVSPTTSTFTDSSMNVGGLYNMAYETLSSDPISGRSFILP